MWILGNRKRDVVFFVVPGLVGLAFGWGLTEETMAYGLYLFVALAMVDTGHVYTTFLRTYLNPSERRSSSIYWIVPLAIAASFFCWKYFRVPHLWAFVLYATVYHHVRQFYGISRWYQKLEGRFCRASGYFLYALTAVPFVLYHFRSGARAEFYSETDLFLFPNEAVYGAGLFLYATLVAVWLAFEIQQAKRKWEPGRFLSVAAPALLYGVTLSFGNNVVQILIPLILAHGIGYFGLMALSLERTQSKRYKTWKRAAVALALIAIFCGPLDRWFEDSFINFESGYLTQPADFFQSLLLGIYLIPLFSHFILDAFIWRGKHREATKVYSLPKVSARRKIRKAA